MSGIVFRGNVILPTRLLSRGVVVVENERIVAVGSEGDVKMPNGATVVDAGDGFVGPGFIDIHTHGGAASDYMDGTPDAARTVNRAHARHGTTTIFPTTTTGTREQLAAMLDAVEEVARDWKVEDGARRAAEPALLAVLHALELVSAADLDALAAYARPAVWNTRGESVGEIVAHVTLTDDTRD